MINKLFSYVRCFVADRASFSGSRAASEGVGSASIFIPAIVACALVVGCGGGSSNGAGGSPATSTGAGGAAVVSLSCAHSNMFSCAEYHDVSSTLAESLEKICADADGVLGSECSTDHLLGCCTLPQSGIDVALCYYEGQISHDQAKMQCDQTPGGVWSDSKPGGGGSTGAGGAVANADMLLPLAVGNTWVYASPDNPSLTSHMTISSMKVMASVKTPGVPGAVIDWFLLTSDSTNAALLGGGNAFAIEGNVERVGAYGPFSAPDVDCCYLTIPFHPPIGQQDPENSNITWNATEHVSVPAGEFDDCYPLRYHDGSVTVFEYFKRGVGMVKQVTTYNGQTTIDELQSFDLK